MARRRTELEKQPEAGEDRFAPFAEVFTASAAADAAAEAGGGPGGAGPSAGGSPADPAADPEGILSEPPDTRDISAELAAPPRPRLPWLTLLLSGGVVAGLAFTGGALVEKGHLQGSGGTGAAGRNFTAERAPARGARARARRAPAPAASGREPPARARAPPARGAPGPGRTASGRASGLGRAERAARAPGPA